MNTRVLKAAALAVFLALPGQGAFSAISNPDAAYLSSTTLLDFSGVPNSSTFTQVTDGIVTLTSSNSLQRLQVPGGGWSTWAIPPNAETATPAVAFNDSQSVRLSLSPGVGIFGFELEPNVFSTFTVTADFFDGATLLGTITRSISGSSGSRLFAGSDTNISEVAVTVSGSSGGFAMAQFRYGAAGTATVPEPATVTLLLGALALVSGRLMKRSA